MEKKSKEKSADAKTFKEKQSNYEKESAEKRKEEVLKLYALRAGMAYIYKSRKEVGTDREKLTAYCLADEYYDLEESEVGQNVYSFFKQVKENERKIADFEREEVKAGVLDILRVCKSKEYERLATKGSSENKKINYNNVFRIALCIVFAVLFAAFTCWFIVSVVNFGDGAAFAVGVAVGVVGMLICSCALAVLLVRGIGKNGYSQRAVEVDEELEDINNMIRQIFDRKTNAYPAELKKRFEMRREKQRLLETLEAREAEVKDSTHFVETVLKEKFTGENFRADEWKLTDSLIRCIERGEAETVVSAIGIVRNAGYDLNDYETGFSDEEIKRVTENVAFRKLLTEICSRSNGLSYAREGGKGKTVVDYSSLEKALKETSGISSETLCKEVCTAEGQ